MAGLVGIEAYFYDYRVDEINKLVGLARRYGLIATGGGDYHGLDSTGEPVLGSVDVPMESVEQLIALVKQKGPVNPK
jgi:hypothetical protein